MSQGRKHKTSGRVTTRGPLRQGASETQISLARLRPRRAELRFSGQSHFNDSDSTRQHVCGTKPIPRNVERQSSASPLRRAKSNWTALPGLGSRAVQSPSF